MATYQFLTFVLPRKSIETKYGGIPKQLEIKHAEWEKYWDNYNVELNDAPEPNFEDAISTKWWKGIPINIEELRNQIDKIIPRHKLRDEIYNLLSILLKLKEKEETQDKSNVTIDKSLSAVS